jgi:hypothetical protein
MAKKKSKRAHAGTQSSASALTALVQHITLLLEEGGLDRRFAEKLAARSRNEAVGIDDAEHSVSEQALLLLALDGLDAMITQGKVKRLIATMAEMRQADVAEAGAAGAE